MDVTSLPETLDPLVIAVAILSNPSGELEEDETETSSGHWRQCLVSNRVAETLSPQEGNVIPCNQWVVILVSLLHLKSGKIIRSSISGRGVFFKFFFF